MTAPIVKTVTPDDRDQLISRFSKRLRSAREAMHPQVTQRDVAKRLGVSFSAVNLWEQGKTWPSPAYLVELSQWFSASVDWLLGLETSPKRSSANASELIVNTVPVVLPASLVRWKWDVSLEELQTTAPYLKGTAAAITVTSEALSSVILPGDYAVISKAHQPEPNSIVLVTIGKSQEPVLRKFVKEGGDSLLVADDHRYPTHHLDDGARIIGRLIETCRRTSFL